MVLSWPLGREGLIGNPRRHVPGPQHRLSRRRTGADTLPANRIVTLLLATCGVISLSVSTSADLKVSPQRVHQPHVRRPKHNPITQVHLAVGPYLELLYLKSVSSLADMGTGGFVALRGRG